MVAVDKIEMAADFTLPDMSGKIFKLSDFKGKYVLVNFWALWCSPCIKELPSMQTMYGSLQEEGLEILAIHAGPEEKNMESFLAGKKLDFTVVIDEATNIKGWKVPVLPASYLVDPNGRLIYQAIGPREWDVNSMRKLISLK